MIFNHFVLKSPAPWELTEVQLCRYFGWTLDYVRSLHPVEVQRLMVIINAEYEGRKAASA